jgi:putative tricarboxylic transport membrane protein
MSEGVTSSQGGGPDSSAPAETNSFRGGVLVAVFALLLFLTTFAIGTPSPFHIPTRFIDVLAIIFDPRLLSIALGAVGVVTAFGYIPVRAPQDYYGGLVLAMLATLALIASADLPGQRGFAFGPGTAPRLFAGVLLVLAVAVTVVGVTTKGPPIEKYKLRGPLFVLIAICLFASIIRPFGLVAAGFLTFMISIYGSTEMRWIESVIAAALMTAFCVLLFVNLLNLPFQLWPQPNAHVVLWHQYVEFFRLIFGPLLKFVGVM